MEKDAEKIKRDAAGQFVRSKHGRRNDGVISAGPRVVTGTEDATFDTDPDPSRKKQKDRSRARSSRTGS